MDEKNNKKKKTKSIKEMKKKINMSKPFTFPKLPVQDYDVVDSTKLHIPKTAKRIIIIFVVLILLLAVWTNKESFTAENIQSFFEENVLGVFNNKGFPLSISGTSTVGENFQLIENNVSVVTDTSFSVYSPTGRQLLNKQHGLNNPVLKTSDSLAILYNRNSYEFSINNKSSEVYSGINDGKIQCATIGDDGIYAIVCQSQKSLSELTVYSKDNNKNFTYSFSECYVIDACISNDSNYLVTSGLKAHNGELQSLIYIFDLSTSTLKSRIEYDDATVSLSFLANHSSIGIIGQSSCAIIDTETSQIKTHSYDGKTLTSYTTDSDNFLAVTLSGSEDRQNCECFSYYANGEFRSSFATNLKIRSSTANNGITVFLSNSSIYFYTYDGVFIKSENVGDDARKALLNGSKECYVLGASEIKKIGL